MDNRDIELKDKVASHCGRARDMGRGAFLYGAKEHPMRNNILNTRKEIK